MKFAVVGAGLAGASIVKTIINHKNFKKEDEIVVFEPRPNLGVGFPYDQDDEAVMLNVNPDVLSVEQKNPDDFVEWLAEHYEKATNFEGLVSRPKYGKYLTERFEPYFSHKQVNHRQTKVEDLEVLDAHTKEKTSELKNNTYVYRLKTSEGWQKDIFDVVFLAVGHPSYADYYQLEGAKNYIGNPYPMKQKLAHFSKDLRIGIIGSGATGIDLMRYFGSYYQLNHPLTFYVQDEIFYFVDIPYYRKKFQFTFSMDWIRKKEEKFDGAIPLSTILATFFDDLTQEGIDIREVYERYEKNNLTAIRKAMINKDQELALVQKYVAKLVQFLPHLFNALDGEDKDTYLKNYHAPLLFFKARVPYKTFEWLFELLDADKIRIQKGLKDIEANIDGTFTLFANQTEQADRLINATGFDTTLTYVARNSPLIRNLYKQKIILPEQDGRFILVDWPQLHLINRRFGLMENLFFFGLLVGGTQYENNDGQLAIQQATDSANAFMDQRFSSSI